MGHPEPIKIVIITKCPKFLRIFGMGKGRRDSGESYFVDIHNFPIHLNIMVSMILFFNF